MAQDPETGEWKYFLDKCLPFGASISCAMFQRFSNALKHLIQAKSGAIPESITNYLNDFLFLALTLLGCNLIINQFLDLCQELGVPIAIEKAKWASEYVVFLGILLDGCKLVLCLPLDKREKAIKMLQIMISKKKATVKQLQELCGYLNFICKAVYTGQPFIHRMYAKYASSIKVPYLSNQGKYAEDCNHFVLKPFHRIRLDAEFKADCNIWLKFLTNPDLNELVNRPMSDWENPELNSNDICFFSDASASEKLGYGCLLDTNWVQGFWEKGFIAKNKPSIEYLELFTLCAGIFTWQNLLNHCNITVFCDNTAVVAMINNMMSSCKNCMILIRMLTLNGLKHSHRIKAKYVSMKNNYLADALSHGQFERFRKLGPHMNKIPHIIHPDLWLMSKLWLE